MARCRPFPLFVAMLGLFLFFISTEGTRQFDRRSDLKVVPPVSELGWSVPLVGDTSCVPGSGCKDLHSLKRKADKTFRLQFAQPSRRKQNPRSPRHRPWQFQLQL